jgi:hypothetical protein
MPSRCPAANAAVNSSASAAVKVPVLNTAGMLDWMAAWLCGWAMSWLRGSCAVNTRVVDL